MPQLNGSGIRARKRSRILLRSTFPWERARNLVSGARGRTRTGTGFNSRGILSPLRLPISPPGLSLSQQRKAGVGIEPASAALQAAA
jgi:hypothetical protein